MQDTLWIKLTGTSSTKSPDREKLVSVYPNPTNDFAMIYSKYLYMKQIEVINALGQVCSTQQSAGGTARVDVQNLPQGVYTLRIQTDEGVVEKRLVVE